MTSSAHHATLKTSLSTHVDDENRVNFRFEWTVKEWSKRPEKNGQRLESPHFSTTDNNNSVKQWNVRVYPKGINDNSYNLAVLLSLIAPVRSNVLSADFAFWIVNNKGTNVPLGNRIDKFKGGGLGHGWTLEKEEGLFNQESVYLPGDTLTLVCKAMYKNDDPIPGRDLACTSTWPDEWMRENIVSLFEENKSTVVTLSVSGRYIHAHKHILEKYSPVFGDMLRYQSSIEYAIEIVDHDYEVILEMVKFMYTGETFQFYCMADKLLTAAVQYKVKALLEKSEIGLIRNLTIENAIPTLTLSDKHSLQSLRTQVTEFISEHCKQIMQTDSWKELFGSNPQLAFEINALLMQKLNIHK